VLSSCKCLMSACVSGRAVFFGVCIKENSSSL
jgi:hypothetical protein